ncbi:MAG: RluA family pseudouridine synthase [Pirellula sp.]
MTKDKPTAFQLIHLTQEDEGQTLGAALKKRLNGWSWGQVREAILKRRVQVNGNLCLDQARKLSPKDVIKLWRESLAKPVQSTAVKIVYVDDFLVVVEKPPGVTSTRHFEERHLRKKRKQLQPTLEELLPESLEKHFASRNQEWDVEPPIKRNVNKKTHRRLTGQDAQRQRALRLKKFAVIAVHRLDRDTSGLMIFARTPSISQLLGKAFRNHEVVRKYHAVVHGHPIAQTFKSVLVRDRGDGKRGTMPADRTEDPSAQNAITHIRPIEAFGEYSMIECVLETGRTHQIRIHLSEAGHMLCGDMIYNRSLEGTRIDDLSGAPRQALHSATLEFKHPISGDSLAFKMPWPADLHGWLRKLRELP